MTEFLLRGRAGIVNAAEGAETTLAADRLGSLLTSDGAPRYYNMAKAGLVFQAHNVAAQAVSVALATTYTGLVLCNPNNSGKNLVVLGANYALSVAPAAIASLHLITGYSTTDVTHTTPLAAPGIQNAIVGGGQASVAKVDSAATISTPTYRMAMGSGFTAAALYATTPSWIDIGGQIILPPGAFVAWGALTAVTGFGAFTWAELPI